jgi:predicted dehydrogenase
VIHVGVAGFGYWGPNLVRNFVETPGVSVRMVSDLRAERLEVVRARYPSIQTTTDSIRMIEDPTIDAVVIATPVQTHFALAMSALKAGKHVLVEKPLAGDVDDAKRLVDEATARRLVLMVDHTFVYSGAVRKIHELIKANELGQLYYFDSVRINLGLVQHDVNVLWDLAVHDLSIMDYLIASRPVAVSASGASHIAGRPVNIAYLTCHFANNLLGHIHVNWLAPVKVRRTLIGGDRKMIVYDDLEPSEKIKVYDRGFSVTDDPAEVYQLLVGYRTGDMWAPQVGSTEALSTEVKHFVECVTESRTPLTDGMAGLRVVQLLAAANESLRQRGAPVEIHDTSMPTKMIV